MSHSRSGTQGSRDHPGLGQLGVSCTGLARVTTVDADAIGALRRECHGDGNQLLLYFTGIAPSATAALSKVGPLARPGTGSVVTRRP